MTEDTTKPHTVPKYVTYGFFALGLTSAVAFRALIIFQRLEPAWVRPAWYLGTGGYFFFFLYRYMITRKRKKAIARFQLIEKLKANACLGEEDREVALYLLNSIKVSLEDINYFAIFVLSILAAGADLIMEALK